MHIYTIGLGFAMSGVFFLISSEAGFAMLYLMFGLLFFESAITGKVLNKKKVKKSVVNSK